MDIEFFRDLLDGFDSLERLKRHSGLEFGVVSSSFAFHFFCVLGSVYKTAPIRHNLSLAYGPIFRVRLIPRFPKTHSSHSTAHPF
jgi:hypothetical protein